MGNGASFRQFPFLGISDAHHLISHHGGNADKLAQLAKIGKWEFDQVGYLMQKLKALPDAVAGQSVLFNTALFVSSDISDGNQHNHDDMPIVLAGNGGGALEPGRHIVFPTTASKEKISNLFMTMLDAAGVPGATLGDSPGPLASL